MKIITMILLLLSVGCNQHSEIKTNMTDNVHLNQIRNEPSSGIDKIGRRLLPNDSLKFDKDSFKDFWVSFQNDLKNNDKEKVMQSFEFPIHLIHPVIFTYSKDCDTISYTKNELKYHNVDMTKENFQLYYNFMFSDYLKKSVAETTANDILKNGYINNVVRGVSYIFPYNEDNIVNNCYSDHSMTFNFFFKQSSWIIGVSAL